MKSKSQKVKPIEIGKDGLCKCSCADPCPLGKCGSATRCTEEELQAKGIKTTKKF